MKKRDLIVLAMLFILVAYAACVRNTNTTPNSQTSAPDSVVVSDMPTDTLSVLPADSLPSPIQ